MRDGKRAGPGARTFGSGVQETSTLERTVVIEPALSKERGITPMVTASNSNERTVIEFFAALSTGDLERVRPFLHPEATWTPQVKNIPGAGVHKGHKGIIDEFLAPVRGLFAPGDPKVVVDSMASNGALVLTETRGIGRLADGRPYANLYCWAFEVHEGKITAIREYMDSHYVAVLFA